MGVQSRGIIVVAVGGSDFAANDAPQIRTYAMGRPVAELVAAAAVGSKQYFTAGSDRRHQGNDGVVVVRPQNDAAVRAFGNVPDSLVDDDGFGIGDAVVPDAQPEYGFSDQRSDEQVAVPDRKQILLDADQI